MLEMKSKGESCLQDSSPTSEIKHVSCDDGHLISLTLYSAENPRAIVIIAAALGVPQQFYRRYAEFLRSENYDVVTFCYRGTGRSKRDRQHHKVRLEDWGHQDIEAIIRFANQRKASMPSIESVHYVGHSIGGQVLGFAENAPSLDSLLFVASSAPYWQRWAFPQNIKMLFANKVVIPGLALGRKDFPAKLVGLGSISFPGPAARQWANWMGRPDYLFCKKLGLDTDRYASLKQPLLSYGFVDDDIAPEINVRSLLNYFPNTKSEFRLADPKQAGMKSLGHSGFFREQARASYWQESVRWFEQHA